MDKITNSKTKYYPTDKTTRILEIYHLFLTCDEVSKDEIHENIIGKYSIKSKSFKNWNDKTILRDLEILKLAGVPIHFSRSREAYVLSNKTKDRLVDSSLTARDKQFIEKVKRLTLMMKRLHELEGFEPCDAAYTKMFPEISRRTMQRDFATLHSIGYEARYKSSWNTPLTGMDDYPPRHYYIWNIRGDN